MDLDVACLASRTGARSKPLVQAQQYYSVPHPSCCACMRAGSAATTIKSVPPPRAPPPARYAAPANDSALAMPVTAAVAA